MSTQYTTDRTKLSIAHQFQQLRLVELPDEILELVTSNDAPKLVMKSENLPSHVTLCTESKTFSLRSVKTSNSMFIIEPVMTHGQHEGECQSGLRAIASCTDTTELVPSEDIVFPYLEKLVPIYAHRDVDTSLAFKASFDSVVKDLPLSTREVREEWERICAFEDNEACFRPTADVLLNVWKAIGTAAIAEGLDLGGLVPVDRLWELVVEDEYPRGLFNAVLTRIENRNATVMGELDTTKWIVFDKPRGCAWVAALLLETQTANENMTLYVEQFLEDWRIHLFESWRAIPNLSLIQDITRQPAPNTIQLLPQHRHAHKPELAPKATGAKPLAVGRNWHVRLALEFSKK